MTQELCKDPIMWTVRGIGMDQVPGCFVCGIRSRAGNLEFNDFYMHNLSAFVTSRGEATFAYLCFEQGTRIDYRKNEPHWIQIKVGSCDQHLPVLKELGRQWFISEYHVDVLIRAALHADEMTTTTA